MLRWTLITTLLAAGCLGLTGAPVMAAPATTPAVLLLAKKDNENRGANRQISPKQAASRAQSQYGGRVLSVKQLGNQYAVKLIKNGQVKIIYVPAGN